MTQPTETSAGRTGNGAGFPHNLALTGQGRAGSSRPRRCLMNLRGILADADMTVQELQRLL